jgi:fermentation-respiration switch protein FrsA (DUF1100 family)
MTPETVHFDSNGLRIAAHLFTPSPTAPRRRGSLVVSHPGSGVKEQAAGVYARRLAEKGFTTLASDAAYAGESEGQPRGAEDPAQRIEDIKAAVSFLSLHPEIDPDHIGLLGVCASGGYAVTAAATDLRVQAVGMVSGVDIGRFFRQGYDNRQPPEVLQTLLHHAADARTTEARGEGVQTFTVFPASEADARAGGRYVFEGWEYYCTPRGEHPRSARSMPWTSVDKIAGFDGFARIDMIAPRPLLMVVGAEADTRWIAEAGFEAAREPKRLVWIEGASHVDLYDRDPYVATAVDHLADFYAEALG